MQNENFDELANERMEEIQYLGKQIDFDNLTYHYKGKNVPNKFINFKGSLGFSRSIKEGHIVLCPNL